MKERKLKNCRYEEVENLLLSRGIAKPLFLVEAWKTSWNYSLGDNVGATPLQSGGEETSSASLVVEILLNIGPIFLPGHCWPRMRWVNS